MINSGFRLITCFLLLTVCMVLAPVEPATGALLYKSYVIRYYRGWDILCDPYVVQKNDWVYKIFRQKGEISQQDFQEFLEIFKRLNPRLGNVDQIRPGQQILIPLKKLEQGTLPGQASGMVTIPFVTISKISEILEAYSKKYRVAQGDWVSRLVANRFGGEYGTPSYERGLELFKALNPEIKDLNLIYAGQTLTLPDPALQNQPWYQSLFDASGRLRSEDDLGPPLPAHVPVPTEVPAAQGDYQAGDPMAETARALEGKLLNKGAFFFPQEKGKTLELDLAQFPMIELQDGTRILFASEDNLHKADLTMLASRWKNVKVVNVPAQATVEQLLESVFEAEGPREKPERERLSFSDHGVTVTVQAQWIKPKEANDKAETRYICITIIKDFNQRTPEAIRRYLDQHDIIIKDVLQAQGDPVPVAETESLPPAEDAILLSGFSRKHFVKDFFDALGYTYAPNVSISFPYAGIQVNALSNLLSTRDGREILIDFEDLYGDAIQAIEKTGFDIIQIKGDDSLQTVTTKLLDGLKVSYTIDPTFLAAKRPPDYNTFINIKGFLLAEEGQPKTLLAAVPLHRGVVTFFKERSVKVIMTGAAGETP